jgi:RecB family exonuclease
MHALNAVAAPVSGTAPVSGPNILAAEQEFASVDKLLKGRIDRFDAASGLLTDYKSGAAPADGGTSKSEARQLRLYAHLLWEKGCQPREAEIIRADGQSVRLPVTHETAAEEGRAAGGFVPT